jgi:hypothetical protein
MSIAAHVSKTWCTIKQHYSRTAISLNNLIKNIVPLAGNFFIHSAARHLLSKPLKPRKTTYRLNSLNTVSERKCPFPLSKESRAHDLSVYRRTLSSKPILLTNVMPGGCLNEGEGQFGVKLGPQTIFMSRGFRAQNGWSDNRSKGFINYTSWIEDTRCIPCRRRRRDQRRLSCPRASSSMSRRKLWMAVSGGDAFCHLLGLIE